MLKLGDYEFQYGECLGTGSFAHVYKGYNTVTNSVVAVKEIDFQKLRSSGIKQEKLVKSLGAEINIMKMLSHRNILQFEAFFCEEEKIFMMIEYCSGGDLLSYLRKQEMFNAQGLEERNAHIIATQLMQGLKYMHSREIVHRDLKPQNILILREPEKIDDVIIKIADFGFACLLQPEQMTGTVCGSPLYMAPEVLNNKQYSDNTDIWSAGVIIYEMLTGHTPFYARNIVELINIQKSTPMIKLPVYLDVTKNCRELIKDTLVLEPNDRIKWDDFTGHNWFAKSIAKKIVKKEQKNIGSAPARLQYIHDVEQMLDSFEIIDSDIVLDQELEEVRMELKKWIDRTNTLIKIADSKCEIKYYDEGEMLYQKCVQVLSVIIDTAHNFINKHAKINILQKGIFNSDTSQIEFINLDKATKKKINDIISVPSIDENIKLLTHKIGTTISNCNTIIEKCNLLKRNLYTRRAEKLIYDNAILFGAKGKVYAEISKEHEAIDYYITGIHLLEILESFPNVINASCTERYKDTIKDYHRKIQRIRETLQE